MGADKPKNRNFDDILEQGASADEIFKDAPVPKGTSPYELLEPIAPLHVEESPAVAPPSAEDQTATFNILDNDSLFCINRKFAALEGLFHLIGKECSFGELASEILRISIEQVKSEAGSIVEIDFENQCMFFRAVTGRSSKNLLNFTIPRGQGVVGFVCENQQPMALSKVDESSVYLKSISDAIGFDARNILAYPIVIRGATFGCIELLNRLGEESYTDADKEVLSTICEFAARVIENRLLLAAVTRENMDLKRTSGGQREEAA